MNAGNRKFRAAVVVLGIGLLCGCAAPRSETRTTTAPGDEPVVRLPYGTPLKIEQSTPPPTAPDMSASSPEVEEGRAHSLKLFEVEYGQQKAGPPVPEEPASPPETGPRP